MFTVQLSTPIQNREASRAVSSIMLSEVKQAQKDKGCMFSLICGGQTHKHKQYHEKQVRLRGSH
jgi:hypothetical protein